MTPVEDQSRELKIVTYCICMYVCEVSHRKQCDWKNGTEIGENKEESFDLVHNLLNIVLQKA